MILSAASAILGGVLFPDNNNPAAATNPLNMLLGVVGVVGTILALLGLPGMYARAAREGGLMWLVGVALIAITGMLFGVFLGLMGVLVFPALASQAPDLFSQGPPPSFFVLFIVATLANVVGAILMGISLLTTRVYARWCGYVMLVEAVLAAVGFVASGPSSTSVLSQILNTVSPLPLFLVLGWAGYELWSGKAASSDALARRAVAQPA
jgi:hypothetical protein